MVETGLLLNGSLLIFEIVLLSLMARNNRLETFFNKHYWINWLGFLCATMIGYTAASVFLFSTYNGLTLGIYEALTGTNLVSEHWPEVIAITIGFLWIISKMPHSRNQ